MDNIFYHGTATAKANLIKKNGFKLFNKAGIYLTKDKNIALHYAYNKESNLIEIDISDLNILYFKTPPSYFYDLKPNDIEQYIENGYDGLGIENKTELVVFNPDKIRILNNEEV